MRALCATHTVHSSKYFHIPKESIVVKKFSKAAAEATVDSNLLGTVKESSSQIWLAGLGAFAKAQEEGSKMFEALVKEGGGLQKKIRSFADSQINDATNEVSGKITEATGKAAEAWGRLETVFEERVGRAVSSLGVPTKSDIATLSARIDALTLQMQKLNGAKAASPKSPSVTKAAPAAKTAAKPVAKKSIARKAATKAA
jgi:poly(hydroxyalkanoate) granule-associated protein